MKIAAFCLWCFALALQVGLLGLSSPTYIVGQITFLEDLSWDWIVEPLGAFFARRHVEVVAVAAGEMRTAGEATG